MTATPPPPDTLRFTVAVSESVRRGEAVLVTLRLTNTSEQRVTLYLTGRTITFDIVVAGSDGHVVWRRLDRVTTQQIVHVKALAPGETLELRDRWRAAAPTGDYTVTGVIPTDRQPLQTAPVRLRITP
ncbi:MAG TPA: BsuPI-related putative proteinase inhibitor [Gemmatimonadales bacterium]|jgi:hypothetical protein|nr:BsuPI-related putative proteinase inhibitor [Gemmatimonadales bacterium]